MTVKTLSLIIVKTYDYYCSKADKLYRLTPKEHLPRVFGNNRVFREIILYRVTIVVDSNGIGKK